MEVLTEMDEYFNAMSKINLDEPVMPYVKGRLVESDTYNKVQKILNTPELEKAHMYCYDLDLENLEECDVMKINNLYKLGVDRGFIDDNFSYQDAAVKDEKSETPVIEEPLEDKTSAGAKVPCFVAMYSAMKDGQIKTGEAYSHAISIEAAKSDVKAQLSKFGYTNVSILAIEASEEDACCVSEGAIGSAIGSAVGAVGGALAGSAVGAPAAGMIAGGSAGAAIGSKIGEDDVLKGRVHNGHYPFFTEDDEDDSAAEDNSADDTTSDVASDDTGDSSDDSAADDSVSDDTSSDDSADDSSAEDEADDDSADGSEEAVAVDDTSDDDSGEDDADDADDTSDGDDSADDDSADDSEEDADDSEEDTEEDAEDTDADEEADSDDGDDELDDNEKADLKDNYKKTFKNTMLKCKFEDKSFDDLTLKEKVRFFTELSKTWKEDYEPSAFMTDKEIDQLNKIVVKK